MKKLLTTLCLVFLVSCSPPPEVPSNQLVERQGVTYQVNSEKPFTGISVEYYIVTMISPGRVDTQLMRDSGWTGKAISAEKSAGLVMALIARLEPEMKGRLVMYNGTIIPW